jgi:tRNA(adenine34) deaminase
VTRPRLVGGKGSGGGEQRGRRETDSPGAPPPDNDDERWMRVALDEAMRAAEEGEVPVGAVVVLDGRILGRGHNRTEKTHDPTAHAEILAIGAASTALGDWRLANADIYVTLEPCAMCAGAIQLGRFRRLVFGPRDPKFGACGSVLNVVEAPRLNHQVEVTEGVLADESRFALRQFFRRLRQQGREVATGDPFDPE